MEVSHLVELINVDSKMQKFLYPNNFMALQSQGCFLGLFVSLYSKKNATQSIRTCLIKAVWSGISIHGGRSYPV